MAQTSMTSFHYNSMSLSLNKIEEKNIQQIKFM